jgi:hypothetical protein
MTPNNFVEEQLGVPATSRNWSTVNRVLQLAATRIATAKHLPA